MIIHSDFQITSSRNKKYDVLLHKPYLERTEAEHYLCYYFLKNLEATAYFTLGVELMPHQGILLRTLFRKSYVMMILSRGASKTFVLGVYAALRAMMNPGSKIVVVGANRRQSLFVFNEVSKIYYSKNSGIFRDCCIKAPTFQPEESYLMIKGGEKSSKISSLPLASGDRIRGLRSTHMLVDEANIVPEDIYKTVLSPMGAVSSENVDAYKRKLREQELIKAGVIVEKDAMEQLANQIVMSSSAGYQFQFLYKEYLNYKKIISDCAKENKPCPYAIVQLGWETIEAVSPGYLELPNIEVAKKTFSFDKFDTEYNAKFVSDSMGFYPRSLLENRSIKLNQSPSVEIKGDDSVYILAIDPSSAENPENDYFGIVVGKLDLVNRKIYLVNASGSTGQGWIHHVNLVKEYIRIFKPKYIVVDRFGGGVNLADTLRSEEYMKKEDGDKVIQSLEKDDLTTYDVGLNRILRLVTFEPIWIEEANFHFKSMLDHGNFWFAGPAPESIYSLTTEEVEKYDDAHEGVEECKNELSLIVQEAGNNGKSVFKLPESIGQVKKTKRVRKDLYTASLLLAWGCKEYFQMIDTKPQGGTQTYDPNVGLA
jgi:hypothetical protein